MLQQAERPVQAEAYQVQTTYKMHLPLIGSGLAGHLGLRLIRQTCRHDTREVVELATAVLCLSGQYKAIGNWSTMPAAQRGRDRLVLA